MTDEEIQERGRFLHNVRWVRSQGGADPLGVPGIEGRGDWAFCPDGTHAVYELGLERYVFERPTLVELAELEADWNSIHADEEIRRLVWHVITTRNRATEAAA